MNSLELKNIISFSVIFIFVTIFYIIANKILFKKEENAFIILILAFMFFSFYFIIIIYYLDFYNIPTILNLNKSLNTQNWLSFLGSFAAPIITTIVSSVILYFQLHKEDTMNNGNLRIQNIPILKYDIQEEKANNYKINIKNIGLGIVKDIYVIINDKEYRLQNQSLIEKEESRDIKIEISKLTSNQKPIVIIKYKDILDNWYQQKIIINSLNDFKVDEEELIRT